MRNERIEAILAAWYHLRTAEGRHKTQALAGFHRLVDEARAGTSLSRSDLQEALYPRFAQYQRARVAAENQFRKSQS